MFDLSLVLLWKYIKIIQIVINLVIVGSNFVFTFQEIMSKRAMPNMNFSERGYIFKSIYMYKYDHSVP